MILRKQRKPYECVLYSVAMCTSQDPQWIRDRLRFDPEEIVWPEAVGPMKYRGIQIDDLIPVIFELGFYAMPFIKGIQIRGREFLLNPTVPMMYKSGILGYPQTHHIVAWNAGEQKIYDPRGNIRDLDDEWGEFWVIERRL